MYLWGHAAGGRAKKEKKKKKKKEKSVSLPQYLRHWPPIVRQTTFYWHMLCTIYTLYSCFTHVYPIFVICSYADCPTHSLGSFPVQATTRRLVTLTPQSARQSVRS
jgi:hypothetical protein